MHPPESGVTVRMYRTGLGDCFLLCFPKPSRRGSSRGASFVLIDCGVFKGTQGGSDRIKKIAEHIYRATNGKPDGTGTTRLDLLVVTHEHWDHLSGFHQGQAQETFKKFEVGQVWLPWTEDENDELARRLRGQKVSTVKALHLAYTRIISRSNMRNAPDLAPRRDQVRSALNMFGAGDDAGEILAESQNSFDGDNRSAKALSWIKTQFKDVVAFRKPGPDPRHSDTLSGVEGARFFVLGPPYDDDLIRRLKPRERDDEAYSRTKGMASAVAFAYFAAFGAMPDELVSHDPDPDSTERRAKETRRRSRPFDEAYRVEVGTAEYQEFYNSSYFTRDEEWRRIDTDWLAAVGQFALNVDGLANNSSLALAIELSPGGKVLLFPGDAQMGNWLSWFGKVTYPGGPDRGQEMIWNLEDGRTVDARDLLARTVLYKVGHHGSHNATLKKGGLEIMGTRWPDEFVAMLPVDENVARNHAGYGEMPLNSIVSKLLEMTDGRLLRTDEGMTPEAAKNPRLAPTIAGVGNRKPLPPQEFPKNRSDDPGPDRLYFDYTIPSET